MCTQNASTPERIDRRSPRKQIVPSTHLGYEIVVRLVHDRPTLNRLPEATATPVALTRTV